MHARVWAQPTYYSLPAYKKEPEFPFLADEIAEARPDMNIKVAAFIVNEKSINALLKKED